MAASMKMSVFWHVAPCILVEIYITVITETVSTSETSVNFYETTRRNIQVVIFAVGYASATMFMAVGYEALYLKGISSVSTLRHLV
jgi:hypothetical protein